MRANTQDTSKTGATAAIASLVVGFVFPMLFFAFNDSIRVEFSEALAWSFFYLIPAAVVISIKSGRSSLFNLLAILAGIFIGTCIAIIAYYPNKGLFIIAAPICTLLASIPVVLGSAIGILVVEKLYKQK